MSFVESDPPPLSTLSQRLKKDTFVFSCSVPTKLLFAFNQKLTRASNDDIHRWAHLRYLGPTLEWPSPAPRPDFLLRPVKFSLLAILSYRIEPTGDPIPNDSKDPLPEGNYGYFFPHGKKLKPGIWGHNSEVLPLDEVEAYLRHYQIEWIEYEKNEIPTNLSDQIRKSYGSRCAVSDETEDTIVSWIFPPAYAHLADRDPSESGDYKPDDFRCEANLFVIRRDLLAEFWRNTFSFDPTDNYRTFVFREMPIALRNVLPEHLNIEALSPGAGKFIAMHFNYTLVVTVMFGEIRDEFTHNHILGALEQLGIGLGWGSDVSPVPLDDPRWDTILGRAIRAFSERSEHYLKA